MKYRPEIDGLRAISILSVLAFHAKVAPFRGGFVGVDIFFVISGYLITSMIKSNLDAREFSFFDFYIRRTVRIIPALLVMTLCTFAVAYVYLYPIEFEQLAISAIWSSLSFSNVYFYLTSDYFGAASNSKPLLHTWSLGVEEQFYIIYPMLLSLIYRYRPERMVPILSVFLICSLILSTYLSYMSAASAFYLIHSRFWELLLGGLAALLPSWYLLTVQRTRWLPEIGLAMLMAAIFLFDSDTVFPGIAALLPCAGSALLLASMDEANRRWSIVPWLLRLRPAVFIGQISYSLYLWHWPLIVFQRIGPIVHTGLPPIYDKTILMGLIFGLSYLSWAFVEAPFRRGVFGIPRPFRALGILCGSGAACMLFAWTLMQSGFPRRFVPEAINLANYLSYDPSEGYRTGECFLTNQMDFAEFNPKSCLAQAELGKSYLLIGDSHAADLYPGLEAVLGKRVNLLQATATGCKPVLRDVGIRTTCASMTKFIYDDYLKNHSVDLVIMSARWGDEDIGPLSDTIRELKARGQPVAIMGPTPEFTLPLPRLLAQSIESPGTINIQTYLYPSLRELDRRIASMAEKEGVMYISLYAKLCPNSECISTVDGAPLYFDASHLTKTSSIFLAGRIIEIDPPL
jgi:peptidoglycan/LPS O-acetylase OafA/YrhL